MNNIRRFVRVYELSSMSAAARITRSLQPTGNGRIFYDGARRVQEAIDEAEAAVMDVTQNPRGTICVAAPAYIARRGLPADGAALVAENHNCLNLRFAGAREFQWTLQTPDGSRRFAISGPFESDDGDVLIGWALAGRGIVLKPVFEVAQHLTAGRLVPVATANPPLPVQLSTLSQHRRLKDSKVQLFADWMVAQIRDDLRHATQS